VLHYKGLLLLLTGMSTFAGTIAMVVPQQETYIREEVVIKEEYKHQEFLDFLIQCESGGNEQIINKADTDGTPSYGLLQFKIGTLYYYIKKYNILPDIELGEIMNVIFDGELQVKVFKEMMNDPEVDLTHEFPTCYKMWKAKQV